jgi:hypothetical protein
MEQITREKTSLRNRTGKFESHGSKAMRFAEITQKWREGQSLISFARSGDKSHLRTTQTESSRRTQSISLCRKSQENLWSCLMSWTAPVVDDGPQEQAGEKQQQIQEKHALKKKQTDEAAQQQEELEAGQQPAEGEQADRELQQSEEELGEEDWLDDVISRAAGAERRCAATKEK